MSSESTLRWKPTLLLVIASLVTIGMCLSYLLTSDQSFLLDSSPNSKTASEKSCPREDHFQSGIVYPRWKNDGYGQSDKTWRSGISTMQLKTAPCWIEMPLLFHQSSPSSTDIAPFISTPSVSSFSDGVGYAHSRGLHVFVVPLIKIEDSQPWAGNIQFSTLSQQQEWFANYWQVLKPYVTAATQAQVEQFAIGTELEWLQQNAPDHLWNTLISQFRHEFHGMLTYDMNWTAMKNPPASWMRNPALKTIGISEYAPLTTKPGPIQLTSIPALWRQTVQADLDRYAHELGKPLLLSEFGYSDRSDAYYKSWVSTPSGQPDPQLQAALFEASLSSLIADPNIAGIFLWGWDEVEGFSLQDKPATLQVIHNHYNPIIQFNIGN